VQLLVFNNRRVVTAIHRRFPAIQLEHTWTASLANIGLCGFLELLNQSVNHGLFALQQGLVILSQAL